jgi:hypothetical protein
MQTTTIAISVALLAIIAGITLLRSKQKGVQNHKPSNLALMGMLLVVLAIFVSDNRWLGYALIGLGVLLAVVDIFRNQK